MKKRFNKISYLLCLGAIGSVTAVRAQTLEAETPTLDTTPTVKHDATSDATDSSSASADSPQLDARVTQATPREPTAKEYALAKLQAAYEILSHEVAVKHLLFSHGAKKMNADLMAKIGDLQSLMNDVSTMPDPTATAASASSTGSNARQMISAGSGYGDKLSSYLGDLAAQDAKAQREAQQNQYDAYYGRVLDPGSADVPGKLLNSFSGLRDATNNASYNSTTSQQRVLEALNDINDARTRLIQPNAPKTNKVPSSDLALSSMVPQTTLQLEVLREQMEKNPDSPKVRQAFNKLMMGSYRTFEYPQDLSTIARSWDDKTSGPMFEQMFKNNPRETFAAIKKFAEANTANPAKNANNGDSRAYAHASEAVTPKLIAPLIAHLGDQDAEDALVALIFQQTGAGGKEVALALEGKHLTPLTVKRLEWNLNDMTQNGASIPTQVIQALIDENK